MVSFTVANEGGLSRFGVEHDPEKWVPVFPKRSCSNKKIERDDDSKKSHPALGVATVARTPHVLAGQQEKDHERSDPHHSGKLAQRTGATRDFRAQSSADHWGKCFRRL